LRSDGQHNDEERKKKEVQNEVKLLGPIGSSDIRQFGRKRPSYWVPRAVGLLGGSADDQYRLVGDQQRECGQFSDLR
jgi:hypothetical protein